MKNLYLLSLLLLSPWLLAQMEWEKVETYAAGTKITYYKDACESIIPDTENLLTFCDSQNNKGVVEASYGLSQRSVNHLVPNHYNNDEVYVVHEGISIHKEDGTWQNIPNIAMPRSALHANPPSMQRAVVHTDGKIYYYHGNMWGLHWVDIETMETGLDEFNSYTSHFASDVNNGDLYAFYVNASTTNFVKKEANGTITRQSLPVLNYTSIKQMLVHEGYLYFVANQGIFKLNLSDYNDITQYDSNTLGVAFNQLGSGNFDNDGMLWLGVPSNVDAQRGLLRFDPDSESATFFQVQNTNGNMLSVSDVQPQPNGEVWALATNFSGLIRITMLGNDQMESDLISLTDFENNYPFDLVYNFGDVALQNGKAYLCGSTASTSTNEADEILIYDFGTDRWTSINDNQPGNISAKMANRFTKLPYATREGVWWSNAYDDLLVLTRQDDTFSIVNLQHSINSGVVVDADDAPVVVNSNVKKIYPPAVFELPRIANESYTVVKRYKDQIWAWNNTNRSFTVYRYNQMIASYDLTGLPSTWEFDFDENGHIWFSHYDNSEGELTIHKYNPSNQTLTPFVFSQESPFGLRKVLTGNGYMVFLYASAVFVYNGTELLRFDNSSNSAIGNLIDAVADESGGLHVLRNDPAEIISFSEIFSGSPVISSMRIDGSQSIIPYVRMYRPDGLILDYQGHFWTHGSNNWMKIKMDDIAQPYTASGTSSGITGLVYLDSNENNQFDLGEEYPNQKVTMVQGSHSVTSFTDKNGRFFFIPGQLGEDHRVTLTSFSPFVRPVRIQGNAIVNTNQENTDLGEFQLEPVQVDGLFAKSSEKVGLWAFTRPGFENAFTTAIGSISPTRTYNDLQVEYLFKNPEGSNNVLPEIENVELYRISPSSLYPIIQDVRIEPRSNNWWLVANPGSYTQSLQSIEPEILQTDDEVKVTLTIPQILPYETYILQINTALFDAVSNGVAVTHGLSKFGGSDLGGPAGNPVPRFFDLLPREENPDLGTPADFNPYIHPDDVIDDIPFDEPKDFYIPPPQKTKIYSSYDPNDKLVSPGLPDELNQQDINEKWLYYTIRFENEGNFSAKDVAIIDTLDTNLDLNTFTLYESSHPVTIEFININEENIVKFDFKDIYLDYTANDPEASQGYVKFWIRAKDEIALETIVENSASIYFDQNPPVYTNTTQNQFVELNLNSEDFVAGKPEMRYFPNPFSEKLNLVFPEQGSYTINIFDMIGRHLFTTKINNSRNYELNLGHLKTGMYVMQLTDAEGQQAGYKIIKK